MRQIERKRGSRGAVGDVGGGAPGLDAPSQIGRLGNARHVCKAGGEAAPWSGGGAKSPFRERRRRRAPAAVGPDRNIGA